MELTEQEKRVLEGIANWEEQYAQYIPTDFEMVADKWLIQSFESLPTEMKDKFFEKFDTMLFHLHALIQGSQFQMEAKERLLSMARVFDESIATLEDLKNLPSSQLKYMADQQIARQRLFSFTQGGMTGTGGFLLLGIDIPLVIAMNLRAIQMIAMTYGYEVNTPREMMISLKVFHAATLPKRMRYAGWAQLKDDVMKEVNPYWYDGSEELTNETWIEQPLKQLVKVVFISMFRKKLIQGLPLIGMAIGAAFNYQLARQVTDFAHRFYQWRHLNDKSIDEM